MTVYGYARVSTTDQSLDIQIAALKAAGCEKIRSEKQSGTTTNGRQELKTLLEFIDAGDVLMHVLNGHSHISSPQMFLIRLSVGGRR